MLLNQIQYKLLKISVRPNIIGTCTCFQDIWPEHVIKCFEILKNLAFSQVNSKFACSVPL